MTPDPQAVAYACRKVVRYWTEEEFYATARLFNMAAEAIDEQAAEIERLQKVVRDQADPRPDLPGGA